MPSGKPEPLLLDTHIWVWLAFGEVAGLTPEEIVSVEEAGMDGRLYVSVVSVWEVAMLDSKKRLDLDLPCEEWVHRALQSYSLNLAHLTPEIAIDSTRLPGAFHGDPADRMLVATARRLGARFMTRDRRIRAWARHGRLRLL